MLDAVLPPTVARCSQRISSILIAMAVLAMFLFPSSAAAGTEIAADRYVTAGLLAACGLALRFLPAHTFLLLTAHGAAQYFFGATWAAVLSAVAVAYGLGSLARTRSGAVEREHEEREMTAADIVYENVEAVVMALLIALTVREFLYEAFLIPTASMQPTILGKEERVGRKHGDRLLATKIPMLAGDPPRWSIVVFKYPLYRRINYIKRLVGLPGERVEIQDGDIYVNGNCTAKPESVQDALWFREYPTPGQERALSLAFQPTRGQDGWDLGDDAASVDAPAGEERRLDYDERLAPRDHDLCVGTDIDVTRLDEGGAVLLRVEGAHRRVDLEVGADSAVLNAPGLVGHEIAGVHVGAGERVTLGVADRVIRVWLDGRLVARVAHEDMENDGPRGPSVSLGIRGGAATFSDVRVDRDLQYQKTRGWDVPDDGFIMLGDNTASSKDSREWKVNVVTTADGTVFEGESEVKLEDNSNVRFTNDGTNYRFIDVDGVFRVVPMEGATLDSGAPRPFVRRRDLVGRAFVVFFPFPPFGDFRPRFLP